MDLVLASASPRRAELLGRLGLQFRVLTAHTEEVTSFTDPADIAADLARQKAHAAAALAPGAVLLAADTLVALGNEVLGKPADERENLEYLRRLSGRTHTVFTGVTVLSPSGENTQVEATRVTFRELSPAEREWYARSGEGLDKAGGYGIQQLGMALVARVDGDYSNVVGLPLALTIDMLRDAGVPVLGKTAPGGSGGGA